MNALRNTFYFDGATYEDHGSTEFAIKASFLPATLVPNGGDFMYKDSPIADTSD